MPYDQVPGKFKAGTLHSGGPSGPIVKDRKQMVAIMLSEKRKAKTNPEYAQAGRTNVGLQLFRAMQQRKTRKR